MRPTPGEFALGLRGLLREIGLEVTSEKGVRQLRRAMATLRDVRWNDAGFDVLEDNALLAQALDKVRHNATASAAIASFAPELNSLLDDHDVPKSFVAANTRNRALRDLLCRCLTATGASDLAGSSTLRREITEHLLQGRGPG